MSAGTASSSSLEESFAGTLEAQGFEERLMRLGPPPEQEEEPGQFWKDFIRDTAPVFRKPTIEQLGAFIEPTWRALCDGARYVDERLREILDELQPDVVVEDNVVCFPALAPCGRPWVRIVSCNPLELKDPALPPVFSGYPRGRSQRLGGVPRRVRRARSPTCTASSRVLRRTWSAGRCPTAEFIHESAWLNLYLYPDEVDYARDAAARADVAPAGHVRAPHRRDRLSCRPRSPRARARSCTSRSAASARPTSS